MGTGSIVERFLDAVAQVEGVECAAVYSRKRETGEKLAGRFGIGRVSTDPDGYVTGRVGEITATVTCRTRI